MPFRYRDATDQNELKARIVERVRASGSVEAACREAGMPHHETMRRWAAADEAFAAMLADARRRGWFALKWAFDEAKARRVLEHLRTGGTLKAPPAGPGWPSAGAIRYWRATDGEFGAEVLRLQALRRETRACGKSRRGPRAAFDRAMADKAILAVARGARVDRLAEVDPELPGRGLIRRWRREDEDFATGLAVAMRVSRAKRRREPAGPTPRLRQRILDRIRQGESLSSLGGTRGMPSKGTLYAWVRRSEDFAAAVMRACDDREDWWADQVGEAMDGAASGSAKALRRRLAPLRKQWARHQHRPGRKWR